MLALQAVGWMNVSLHDGKLFSKPVYRADLSTAECCNRDNVVCRCEELPSAAKGEGEPSWV